MKDSIDVIKALDSRLQKSSNQQRVFENEFQKKVREIEVKVLEQLKNVESGGTFNIDFKAFEDSVQALQDQVIEVEKEFLAFRERISSQSKNALDLSSQVRDDYNQRVMELRNEIEKREKELRIVIEDMRSNV